MSQFDFDANIKSLCIIYLSFLYLYVELMPRFKAKEILNCSFGEFAAENYT